MSQLEPNAPNRRPVAMRESPAIQALARHLTRAGVHPNAISVASVLGSAVAAGLLTVLDVTRPIAACAMLVAAPLGIAFRGLCNLLDGLVAIEGGRRTRSGELFNELPDRISDPLLFAGAGYAVAGVPGGELLGWTAAVLSIVTAYVRALGGAMGAKQYFIGPMAKTHRMAVLALGCLAAAVEVSLNGTTLSVAVALMLIVVGCVMTIARRARLIYRELEQ